MSTERLPRTSALRGIIGVSVLAGLTSACALQSAPPPGTPETSRAPAPSHASREPSRRPLHQEEALRLQRVMTALVRAMAHPYSLSQVTVGIMGDPHVNAASAGGGEFHVTTGLLQKANDGQLAGVLAHVLAHDDLGHVAKAPALGAGPGTATIGLEPIIPGSGVTPMVSSLMTRAYSRNEEYAADRHGVDILTRAGYLAGTMATTLRWLTQMEGTNGGGFFATHPATGDRIEALRDAH